MRFMTTVGLVAAGALVLAMALLGVMPGGTTPATVEMGAAIAPMAAATTAPQPLATANPVAAPRTNPNIASDPKTNPNIASDPETNPNIAGDTTALLMAMMVLFLLAVGVSTALRQRRRSLHPRGQTVGSMAR